MAMDFITSPTAAVPGGAPASTVTRTPDSDTDTPPTPRPSRPHAHYPHPHHHAPGEDAPSSAVVVTYRECMKNHAASSGGHALDGCCEFMPGPTFNPADPTSLKCAACGCHRNFHRRDPDDPAPLHHHPPAARGVRSSPPSASQLLLSLSGQSPSGPSDEIDPRVAVYFNGHLTTTPTTATTTNKHRSKKRFRTKFSQEQKEKMQEFAGKIGWRLRRGEERLVEEFCRNAGVERGVFKVWMHNNKNNNSSSSRPRSEKDQHQHHQHQHHVDDDGDGDGDDDVLHHQHHNHSINGGSSSNNGSSNCGGAVVYHEFYANNGHGGAQEAQ